MLTSSQLIPNKQTILPEQILEDLTIDTAFTDGLQGTLDEWDSPADDEAYADL